MTKIEIRYPKLTSAWFCMDCETIFEKTYKGGCPCCTSSIVFPLSKWIAPMNQKEKELNQCVIGG